MRPFTAQQLIEFGKELIEQFIKRVVLAVAGAFIPGEEAFDQLRDWALNLPVIGDIIAKINEVFSAIFGGIDFTGELPTPEEVWDTVINTLMLPLNLLLGPNSPLNPANILGRLRINQIGGVSLSHVITQTSNLFAEFIAEGSVPAADGWSFDAANSAAQVVLDGTTKAIYDDPIDVAPGQEIAGSVEALLDSVTSSPGAAVELALLLYDGVSESPTGTYVFDSIADPSGTVTWAELSGTYTVPASGVKAVAPELRVEGGTSGTVKFKTPAGEVVLPSVLQDGLPKAIQDRIDAMQDTWDAFKGAAGGTVSDIQDALDDAGQAIRDALANALGHGGSGHTSANLLTYFQQIPQGVVDGLTDLSTQTNQIIDILAGAVVTPIDAAVQAVKDWWDQWFGGGSSNAIPLAQKGAVNGVAPLDGNRLIPEIYLPAGSGGGGGGVPTEHVLLTLAADQSIPSGVATALTGWQQIGSVEADFDGTNTEFSLPLSGWWDVQSQVVWGSSTTGKRQSAIVRTLSSGSVVPAVSGEDAADFPAWGVRNAVRAVQEVAARSPMAATDAFSVEAYQNSGGALNAVAGYPDGTYVLATYLGERESEFVPFTEENVTRVSQPVPDGAAGCWVTLGGGGGGGGGGRYNSSSATGAALGSTYSVTRGLGGNAGTGNTTGNGTGGSDGGASVFSSGSVTLTAGGGNGGGGGTGSGSTTAFGGSGGTASAVGSPATTASGTAGASVPASSSIPDAVDNTDGASAGGGAGRRAASTVTDASAGGDSTTNTGGARTSPSVNGGGGAGTIGNGSSGGTTIPSSAGKGGAGGGGGGGGGGSTNATFGGNDGAKGGDGFTLIEWE